jgi:MFS transporter, AAHS family, 3-hydroxyphenylpropionic acid transporter
MIADREASPPRLTVFLCFLGAICEGFDIQAAGVAAGGLIRVFRPTPHTLGLFFSASGLGLLLGALVGGRVSDLMGRKPVLVASITAFGIFSFLTSLAPDMNSLIAARFLTGLGLGGAMPNLIALAADSSTSKSRTANIAAAYVGMPFGGVAASLVIFLIPLDAWRLVFQIGGAAPLIIVPLMIWLLPRRKPAALKVAAGTWVAPNMARALFGNGRAPRTLLLWMSFFLIVLTLHLMLNWLPLLLTGRGLLKGQAAIAQAGFNAGGGLLALLLGVVLDSRWRRIAVAVSMVMLPAMLVSAAVVPARPDILIGVAFLLGGAILAQQVIVFAAAGACYPVADRGTGVGSAVAAGRLGSLTGPLFAASLLAAGQSPSRVLIGVLPIVLVCGISAGLLGWRDLKPNPA